MPISEILPPPPAHANAEHHSLHSVHGSERTKRHCIPSTGIEEHTGTRSEGTVNSNTNLLILLP